MKNNMHLLRAMSDIRPEYIEEAADAAPSGGIHRFWRAAAAVAAVACIGAAVLILIPRNDDSLITPANSAQNLENIVTEIHPSASNIASDPADVTGTNLLTVTVTADGQPAQTTTEAAGTTTVSGSIVAASHTAPDNTVTQTTTGQSGSSTTAAPLSGTDGIPVRVEYGTVSASQNWQPWYSVKLNWCSLYYEQHPYNDMECLTMEILQDYANISFGIESMYLDSKNVLHLTLAEYTPDVLTAAEPGSGYRIQLFYEPGTMPEVTAVEIQLDRVFSDVKLFADPLSQSAVYTEFYRSTIRGNAVVPRQNSGGTTVYDIYARLNALNFAPVTCDGIPEYKLTASDGTVYWLNFSSRWVWRDDEEVEAMLPADIIAWLTANGSVAGLQPAEGADNIPQVTVNVSGTVMEYGYNVDDDFYGGNANEWARISVSDGWNGTYKYEQTSLGNGQERLRLCAYLGSGSLKVALASQNGEIGSVIDGTLYLNLVEYQPEVMDCAMAYYTIDIIYQTGALPKLNGLNLTMRVLQDSVNAGSEVQQEYRDLTSKSIGDCIINLYE